MSKFKLAAFIGTLLMAASMAGADVRVYLQTAPPRSRVERRSPAPDRSHVWVRGHQRWGGASHEWVPGHWEARPRRNANWRNGSWRRDRRQGWYWTEGGWR